MKKFRILSAAILGLSLFSCEQETIYYGSEGGDQGIEVTAKFESNNPLPEGLDGDIHSFSFTGQKQCFNVYHGANPYNPPFTLSMEAGTYDMLFMTSDMNNMENLALNWGEGNEDMRAEAAYFEFANVEQAGANGYEYRNSPFKDKEWYMRTMFVEHASSCPVHIAEPPVWMASYEADVVIEEASKGGVSTTIPTESDSSDKITKLTTYPQQMVYQPTFTVKTKYLSNVKAIYMSISALKGGAPLIPGYSDNAEPITYEAQMELTDNGDSNFTATKKFNTFGLDECVSENGIISIVIEYGSDDIRYVNYDFYVSTDDTRWGKEIPINIIF